MEMPGLALWDAEADDGRLRCRRWMISLAMENAKADGG